VTRQLGRDPHVRRVTFLLLFNFSTLRQRRPPSSNILHIGSSQKLLYLKSDSENMKLLAAALLEKLEDDECSYHVFFAPSIITDGMRITPAILYINSAELSRSGVEIFDTVDEAHSHAVEMFMGQDLSI
jgi:hypothetical protein